MMVHGQCLTCAPNAWDYPPRGGSHLTCGCWQPFPHDAYEVISYWGEDEDEDGERAEYSGGCYCPFHALLIKVSGLHIDTWVPGEVVA